MTSYPCPVCGASADLVAGCSGCGRSPDPDAAEVLRLAAEIHALSASVEQARQAYAAATARLQDAQQRRNALASQVRARAAASPVATPAPTASPGPSPGATPVGVRVPEASTHLVQNVLFILGGLLLGVGAIVFTAVAWATFGVAGRAAILACVTGLALGAPVLALRRGLAATAETFAAVGLLLVLLDGYAAWAVNLAGVTTLPSSVYAGLVCVVTALIAAGYGMGTRLSGPRLAALVVAQPVLPLFAVELHPGAAGWALVFAAVAAADLAVPRAPVGLAMRVLGWLGYGVALLVAVGYALDAELVAQSPGAAAFGGAGLLAVALLLILGAVVSGQPELGLFAGGLAFGAAALAFGRELEVAWPGQALVLYAATVTALALLAVRAELGARAGTGREPAHNAGSEVRRGARVGALVCLAAIGAVAVALTVAGVVDTLRDALPPGRAGLLSRTAPFDWQLPAALALLTVGLIAALPAKASRQYAAVGGTVLIVLALPAGLPLLWWHTAAIDLAVAAVLVMAGVLSRSAPNGVLRAGAAALLAAHALVVGLARPASTAAVLGTLVLLGVVVAAGARPLHRITGGVALAVGLAAWPAAVGATVAATPAAPEWALRAAMAAAALLPAGLVAIRRWLTGHLRYAEPTALVVIALVGTYPARAGEPQSGYAALALLFIGFALWAVADRKWPAALSVWSFAAFFSLRLVAVLPAVWAVLGSPYRWLDHIWAGQPGGSGVSIPDSWLGESIGEVAVALIVLTVAAVVLSWVWSANWRVAVAAGLLVAPVAVLVVMTTLGATWPAIPATSLVLGLAGALSAALPRSRAIPAVLAGALFCLALLLAGAGLVGGLPTRATTLAGLGLVLVTAVVAGVAGRPLAARLAGWLVAVATGVTGAAAAALAAGETRPGIAFWVLGAAALALAVSAWLRQPTTTAAVSAWLHGPTTTAAVSAWLRRPTTAAAVEAKAVEAAAHAAAVVALLFAVGSVRHAAIVCALWGAAVGVRALWPSANVGYRRGLAVAAACCELLAWWLLLAADDIRLVEAYTLPAAVVALLAGALAHRTQPGLRSWLAYGPSLAAAFLPSLAVVLGDSGQPVRRLSLGLGALAAVLLGAVRRYQAPVVLGGATLVAVAVHELVLVSQLLPTWTPIIAAGLLLVWLAITYERRRRDLTRLRHVVTRMS